MTTEEKRKEYSEYLQSAHWQMITEKIKERAGRRCQVCNSGRELETHHRTYEHIFHELDHLQDLICLCRKCHGLFHQNKNSRAKERKPKASVSQPVFRLKHQKFFRRAAQKLSIPQDVLRTYGRDEVQKMLVRWTEDRKQRRQEKKKRRLLRKSATAHCPTSAVPVILPIQEN